jgi:GNAT superfamily N-acetyltransferase
MDNAITLRELRAEEMTASDVVYDRLRFARTDPSCTRMLAAFAGKDQVGLGRFIHLGPHGGVQHFELGGMWVDPLHRRSGLALRIVREMLPWKPSGATLWCTPFEDLMPLYGDCGFVAVPLEEAPPRLIERLDGCASSQDRSVLVTRFRATS